MQTSESRELPDHDDWLEHIDTVVLTREHAADPDPPADVGPADRSRSTRAS